MHCTDFLLLCMTTFAPRTIENLRIHKLTLPHENLNIKSVTALGGLLEYTVG